MSFTSRDLFISQKGEAAVSLSLRHWSTLLDSVLVRQEQLEGPSVIWLRAVGLKWEEFPWDWQLVLYSSMAF